MTPKQWKKKSLIYRLRANRGMWVDTQNQIRHPNGTMEEAADRIEQLEQEVRDLKRQLK